MPFSAVGLFILLLLVSATSRPLSVLHHYHQVVVKLQAGSIPTCPWVSEVSHPVPSVTPLTSFIPLATAFSIEGKEFYFKATY
jgi:hypothetical protein